MSIQELTNILQTWGYPAMLLMMIIEGPVATITGAFLASLGLFNWMVVLFLSILGDVIGDIILYSVGRFGGRPALTRAEKFLRVKQSFIERLQKKFQEIGPKLIFYIKAGTGLCWITFILAGTAKMKFRKFLLFTFLGGIFWSGLLVAFGYFFGYAAERINRYIEYAGIIVFISAIILGIIFNSLRKRQTDKIITLSNDE